MVVVEVVVDKGMLVGVSGAVVLVSRVLLGCEVTGNSRSVNSETMDDVVVETGAAVTFGGVMVFMR